MFKNRFSLLFSFFLALSCFWGVLASARTEVIDSKTVVAPPEKSTGSGEKEAQKYFRPRKTMDQARQEISSDDHYLTLHLGSFLNSNSYRWGDNPATSNTGRLNFGFTYKIDQFTSIVDSLLRVDLLGYDLPEGKPIQLSVLWMLMLPDATSKFPLYFGAGVGPGFFFSQINGESFLALDYQLVGGVRFFNVLNSVGFFAETGMKNHIFLLSDGQFNGFFLTVGSIFTF